jgi:hypothetical protein
MCSLVRPRAWKAPRRHGRRSTQRAIYATGGFVQCCVGSLRAIEDALARISHDRFGVCETCGSRISRARLEAVPWTRLCRDCKEREQSAA